MSSMPFDRITHGPGRATASAHRAGDGRVPKSAEEGEQATRERKVFAGMAAFAVGLTAATATSAIEGDQSREVRQAVESRRAKNVIMFLGDGMGDSEITIARNYAVGAAGRLC